MRLTSSRYAGGANKGRAVKREASCVSMLPGQLFVRMPCSGEATRIDPHLLFLHQLTEVIVRRFIIAAMFTLRLMPINSQQSAI